MRGLEGKHYALLGAFFTSISVQLAGAKHGWADVITPLFVAGIFAQLGVMLGAMYVGAPGATGQMTERRGEADRIADPARFEPPKAPAWLLIATLLGSGMAFPACAGANKVPASLTTPAAVKAYKADQIVDRFREISNVVKGAYGQQQITAMDAFAIIEWISGDENAKNGPTTGIVQAIGSFGAGNNWKQIALETWNGRIRSIFMKYPNLTMYADVINQLLQAILAAPAGVM